MLLTGELNGNLLNATSPSTTPGTWENLNETDLVVETIICVFLSLCIVFGNGLVCIAFATDRKLQTTTNCFVVSLACSDIMVGAVVIPLYLYIKNNRINFMAVSYRIWVALEMIACSSSIASLVVISLERCISVTLPAIHRNLSRKIVYSGIGIVWMHAIFLSGALFDVYTSGSRETWMQLYKSLMSFFIPLLVILVAYAIIFHVAILRTKRHSNALAREIRIALTISLVIGAFVCSWLPFFVLYLLASYHGRSLDVDWKLAMAIVKWLQYLNSVVNPIIYTYGNQDFRKSFLRLLRCFKQQRSRFDSTLVSNRSRAGSHLASNTETTVLRTTHV